MHAKKLEGICVSFDAHREGTVAFVCQGKGKIPYHVRDAKVDYLVKLKEETYEEAYDIIKQQNLLP